MLIWNQSGGAPDSHLKYTDVSLKFPEFNKINQKSYLMIVISNSSIFFLVLIWYYNSRNKKTNNTPDASSDLGWGGTFQNLQQ